MPERDNRSSPESSRMQKKHPKTLNRFRMLDSTEAFHSRDSFGY
ncbi:hypothetical protein EMIT074MI3_10647 [Bacillus licheniformis]